LIERRFAQIAILGLCSYVVRPALADVSVLLITPTDDSLDYSVYESRLRSELLAAGFSVSAERAPGSASFAAIAANAERSGSQAAIAISASEGELCGLLWIADPATSGGIMRPVRCCPLTDDAPLVFAVRATDALSAGLLELRYPHESKQQQAVPTTPQTSVLAKPASKPPTTAVPVATPSKRAEPAPRSIAARPEWTVQAGGAVAAWFRRFPIGYGGKLELTRALSPAWHIGIQGFAFAPASVSSAPGHTSVSQFFVGVVAQYRVPLNRQISVTDGLGAGLYGIAIDAQAPYRARDEFSSSPYLSFEHQIHFRVTRSLSLVASCALAAPWKRYSVIVVDTTVARAAAPLAVAGLGLQLYL
jgi:hypothetical protein